jgi:hypothetical protein
MRYFVLQTFKKSYAVRVFECETEESRDNEATMCLVDPGVDKIIFLDIPGMFTNSGNHAWTPSKAYLDTLLQKLNET